MPRAALFNLAINRAYLYLSSSKGWSDDATLVQQRLEPWYLKTRFAYRIPLDNIVQCLLRYPRDTHEARDTHKAPHKVSYRWQGGAQGAWHKKKRDEASSLIP